MQNGILSNGPSSAQGHITLKIDCDGLLMHDPNRPGIFKSKPAAEAALYFRLETLPGTSIIQKIKIKCFHVCGEVDVEEGACLVTLWGIGDWLVDQYQQVGESAYYEKWVKETMGEWTDPDVLLTLFIDV